MAKKWLRAIENGLGDNWEDLRENGAEITENNLNWLEMTGNNIY